MTPRRLMASALVVLATASIGAACGSDDDSSTAATPPTTVSPEDIIVSDASVAAGLGETIATLDSLAATPPLATDEAIAELYDNWYSYEGTVKQNDTDSYIDFEDALGAFKKGVDEDDPAAMATAATTFSTLAATYLSAHPG